MSETSLRTHPLIVIAATTVILTCLLAIAILTGILPSPTAKDRDAARETASAPAPKSGSALNENRSASRASAVPEKTARAPAGATSGSAPSQSVAGSAPAAKPAAVCNECGTVTSVRAVKQQGEAGLIGPIAGGAIGGVLGSQIGGGSGKTIATVIGAAGGAAAGTEIERRSKSTTHHVVGVRFNDGTTRNFTYPNEPGVQSGDRVKLVDGKLLRD